MREIIKLGKSKEDKVKKYEDDDSLRERLF